jgi:CRISPR-associated endonuclease Cas1 subtype II
LDFSRRDEHSYNPSLNYGYAILLSVFAREIVAAGYLTQLGIWHRGEYNFFNLACDFMEPFRPIIDDFVLSNALCTSSGFKEKLKRIFEVKININGKEQYFSNAVKLFTRGVINYLNLESEFFPCIDGYDLKIDEL